MMRTLLTIMGSLLALDGIGQKTDFYQVIFVADTAFKHPRSNFFNASPTDLAIDQNIWSAYKNLGECSRPCFGLPLTLLKFWGIPSDRSNVLYWTTTNEMNTSHFEVERGVDARIFTKIGTSRSDNSAEKNSYSFVDSEPLSGKNFYRLRMVDIDGQYTYSDIVILFCDAYQEMSLFPNPANTSVTITMEDGRYLAQLYGSEGRLVISQSSIISTPAGFTMNVATLPPGTYTLVLTNLATAANTAKTLVVAR